MRYRINMVFRPVRAFGTLSWGLFALLFLSAAASNAAAAPAAERRVLLPFDFKGVTIDAGPLRRQLDEVRDDYLRIPNDDLLKGFRARAGKPAPGADLGGWYTSDTFHVFGQILSGLARLYAATGDVACRDKANALLHEWGQCIGPDGYFYYTRQPNAPHYIYDKMVGGLVDMILYTHNREAPDYLRRITAWAIKNLDRSNTYAFNAGSGSTEWYTLSENLYRAYLATGDPTYRDFARVWEYTPYWDLYAHKADIFGLRPDGGRTGAYHAYSHVNTLGGAGAAYLVTGAAHYLDTLVNAYDYLQTNECLATGGYGPDELLLPRDQIPRRLAVTHNSFETQCGSWAAFKLCKYLITLTGDARYGDWVERLILNGIGASIPMSADGQVFYYSDYNLGGGSKRNIGTGWTCCTGTRPMAVADYDDLLYFRDGEDLCVDQYASSTVQWTCHGEPVTVRQSTRFPESETAGFTVSVRRPVEFGIKLRAPGWLAAPLTATVDGRPATAPLDKQHWVTIRRLWRDGDRLVVTLPMDFHTAPLEPGRPYPAAILRGPVVLAVRAGQNPNVPIDLAHLDRTLLPSSGEPLTYHLATDPATLIRPFYAFKEGEPYTLYLDPTAPQRISYQTVTFSSGWIDSGQFRFSNHVGATAETAFDGTGIRWLGYRFDDAGRAEVTIDGKVVAIVDQYGPGRDLPFDWKQEGLSPGRHLLQIRILPEKTAASRDRFINVAGLEMPATRRSGQF